MKINSPLVLKVLWQVVVLNFAITLNKLMKTSPEGVVNNIDVSENNGMPVLERQVEMRGESKEGFKSLNSTCPYQPGDWVVVRYDDLLYPGEVISLPSNGIEINAMEPTTCGSYKWPTRKDVHIYLLEDVVKKIEPPIPCGSRASQFTFKDSF